MFSATGESSGQRSLHFWILSALTLGTSGHSTQHLCYKGFVICFCFVHIRYVHFQILYEDSDLL